MPEYTTRRQIPYPDADNSESPAGPAQIKAVADSLDDAPYWDKGIFADRPVSTPASPGKDGRFYYVIGDATPANNGVLWLDYGTGWVVANGAGTIIDTLNNQPAANTVPSGTRFFATDQVAEYVSDGTAWTRVSSPAGLIVMTLAAAADPGYILLQGQAWPSTSGIYADLYGELGGTTLPDFRGLGPMGYKSGDSDFGTLRASGGEKKHTLTNGELPAHHHGGVITSSGGSDGWSFTGGPYHVGGSTADDGGGLSHNNLQPFIVVNFQAKL